MVPHSEQKVSMSHLNFIQELYFRRNCSAVVSHLFSYLPSKDLCTVSWVCKKWRRAVVEDHEAHQRWVNYLEQKKYAATGSEKENRWRTKKTPLSCEHRTLLEVQNMINNDCKNSQLVNTEENNSKSRYQYFLEEAKKLRHGERLQQCPRCTSPSRINIAQCRGHCSHLSCKYDFCTKCFFSYHLFKPCSIEFNSEVPYKSVVCSKASRKNLKRL